QPRTHPSSEDRVQHLKRRDGRVVVTERREAKGELRLLSRAVLDDELRFALAERAREVRGPALWLESPERSRNFALRVGRIDIARNDNDHVARVVVAVKVVDELCARRAEHGLAEADDVAPERGLSKEQL